MLTARHADDLTVADRLALNAHLVSCQACNEVYRSYKNLEQGFRNLSLAHPVPAVFSYQTRQLAGTTDSFKTAPAGGSRSLFSMLLTLLSSLTLSIGWSQCYQNASTWILALLTHVPRRITYVNSERHFLYAMRRDSGYFLWRQQRYRRWEFVSSSPLRLNSMPLQSSGSGIALVAAMDFCKYAVRP